MKPTITALHLSKRCISSIFSPKTHLLQPRGPLLPTMVLLRRPERQSRLPPTSSTFSARLSSSPLSNKSTARAPPAKPRSAKTHDHDQEVQVHAPSVSFESLGISRNMKVVLLVILSVFGSIETYFWCKAIWTWWKGGEEVDG